jgi:hypothetical protein
MYLKIVSLVLIISGAVAYFYYTQNKMQQLIEQSAYQRQQNEQYKQSIEELQAAMNRQRILSEQYSEESRTAKRLADEALRVFDNHNLEFLSYAKPKLIERRVNDSTSMLFREIEDEINN